MYGMVVELGICEVVSGGSGFFDIFYFELYFFIVLEIVQLYLINYFFIDEVLVFCVYRVIMYMDVNVWG